MTLSRRFQYGSVSKRGKRNKVWIGRWREEVANSEGLICCVRRSEILGTVEEIPSKREAELKLWERLQPLNTGKQGSTGSMTLRRFAEELWRPAVFPSLKLSTRLFYNHNLKTHILPEFGSVLLRSLTRDGVQQFLHAKQRSGLSWNSVRHIRTVFGTILNAAEMDDLVRQNVVKKTRLPRRTHTEDAPVVSLEETRLLLAALPEPSRSIAALLTMTGLRIGELLALRWMDVDFNGKTLRVRQTVYNGQIDTPKTKRSNRCVPLSPLAVEILSRQRTGSASDLVFSSRAGSPLCRHNLLNRQLKPTAAKLKLKGFNWHWLRHASASLLDAAGASLGTVQSLLGHASSEVTREHYIHDVPSEARNAVEKMQDLLIGPKWTQLSLGPENSSGVVH
jgi:integrase